MYMQRKMLGIKVCRVKLARCTEGERPLVINKELVGVHLTMAQADKYVRATYGQGYALLSFSNDIEYVNLDIKKIYGEFKEKKHE